MSVRSRCRRAATLHSPFPLLVGSLLALAVLAGVVWPGAAARAQQAGYLPPIHLTPQQQAYHRELMAEAIAKRLWEQRYWHILLHYQRNFPLPGYISQADGPGFFMSLHGKVNPRDEMSATLARFFMKAILPPGKMTAQCTFPARYDWLKEQLHFDPRRLPEQDCPRFKRWRASLDPGSVTLVFASYYFNVPASMFGHTLLRFDKKNRSEGVRLLDYGVSYAAYTNPDDSGLSYAIKGLAGGYRGQFSLLPYYMKVREYNDIENRDIWEYRLNFTQKQIDRILMHTWEMGSTYFDYYFLTENCSYQVLYLLEAGNPKLHLTDQFHLFVLPVDTIRAIMAQPGLVKSVTYRPSRSTQMQYKMSFLSSSEQDLVLDVVDDPSVIEKPRFADLPAHDRALILECAADRLQLLAADSPEARTKVAPRLHQVLLARSHLAVSLSDIGQPKPPPRAESGHLPSRVELGVGTSGGPGQHNGFADFEIQPGMHDLMADERGYPPNSTVQVANLRLRAEQVPQPRAPDGSQPPPETKLRLEHLKLLTIVSVFPWTKLQHTYSWRVHAGWQRLHEPGLPCDPCTPFWLDGGGGIAFQSNALTRTVVFSMAQPTLQVGHMFQHGYRFGVDLSLGVLVNVGERWRLGLIGHRTRFFAGDAVKEVGRATLVQRFTLSRNTDLRLEWTGENRYREARLAFGVDF